MPDFEIAEFELEVVDRVTRFGDLGLKPCGFVAEFTKLDPQLLDAPACLDGRNRLVPGRRPLFLAESKGVKRMLGDHCRYDDGGRAAAGFKGKTGDCVCRAIAIATGVMNDIYDCSRCGTRCVYGYWSCGGAS